MNGKARKLNLGNSINKFLGFHPKKAMPYMSGMLLVCSHKIFNRVLEMKNLTIRKDIWI
jgi:hypothetical protein